MSKNVPYNKREHRAALIGFMSAYDHDDLPDGAWQCMLEEGAAAFTKEYGIRIDTNDAFFEYIEHKDE